MTYSSAYKVDSDLISVLVVSDYHGGDETGWQDLKETLTALGKQDYSGPVEFLLIENTRYAAAMPAELRQIMPGLKVHFVDESSSSAMKNEGVLRARGNYIGVLDGDCTPQPRWISQMMEVFSRFPDTAVVSGRTIYASESSTERIRGLLSRSYLDKGNAGLTDALAINNAGYTRETLLNHPFPVRIGAFGGKLQAESIRRAGLLCRFQPEMLVHHSYEGWGMEKDIRRNTGFATVMVRKLDKRITFSWVLRLGIVAMPLIFIARLALSWWNLLRLRRYYDISWVSVPVGLALAVYLHCLEVPGMSAALTGSTIQGTAYR